MRPETTDPRRETVTRMQRLVSEARPDQIRRLLHDIMADERDIPESYCEDRRRVAGGRAS